MTMDYNNAVSDGFSWSRLKEFAAFYAPMAKKQLLVYSLGSLLFAVLTLLPLPQYAQVGFFTIIWTAIPIMYELAPVVLAKNGDSRIIERLIPVSAAEKFVFYLLYFIVGVGAASYVLPLLSLLLYENMPDVQTPLMMKFVEMKFANPPMVVATNVLSSLAAMLTCLLVVTMARTSRVVKGVIAAFAVQIGVGIMGAIGGLSTAFSMGMEEGMNGARMNSEDIGQSVVDQMLSGPYLYISAAILAVYTAGVLFVFYRNLKKSNL